MATSAKAGGMPLWPGRAITPGPPLSTRFGTTCAGCTWTFDAYGGNFTAGLTVCDYINYYLDVRKSTAAVGSVSHGDYVSWITDLAYNNNIACFLPSP